MTSERLRSRRGSRIPSRPLETGEPVRVKRGSAQRALLEAEGERLLRRYDEWRAAETAIYEDRRAMRYEHFWWAIYDRGQVRRIEVSQEQGGPIRVEWRV